MIELNYHTCTFENIGVVANRPHPFYDAAPRVPILKLLEIITGGPRFLEVIVAVLIPHSPYFCPQLEYSAPIVKDLNPPLLQIDFSAF